MDGRIGRRWVEVPCDERAVAGLVRELGLDPLAARVLACRGLARPGDAQRFLEAPLAELPDPSLLGGMDRAVERLARAVVERERIALYGDYDVDGVTSTALLAGFLRGAGADVVTYVPHRLTEGYGLNVEAAEKLARAGARLLVALDCGVTNVVEVQVAAGLGVDTVVVDHHTVPVELPPASAILNPHQPGCRYPYKPLAAVGVTFCLALALRRRLREAGHFGERRPEPNLKEALDLVALGTIADVVPLTGVNRILVRSGLAELARTRRVGLRALKRVAGVPEGAPVTAGQVGFRLAPRLNAAARLDDASRGVRLLLETDPASAASLAEELDRENRTRQDIERAILSEACVLAEERIRGGARGLVLARAGWHPGVVGIVASRVVERYHRPAVLIGVAGGVGKGSGRSIEGFHLYDALARCAPHLRRFGGHRHAAGLTVDAAAVDGFRLAFEGHAREQLAEDDLVPRCRIEGWVGSAQISERAARALQGLAPYGAGHPEPVFALRARAGRARPVGAAGAHLKAELDGLDAIGFSMGDRLSLCAGEIEAAVNVGFDEWDGRRRLQLRIRDLRRATT